MTDLSNTLDQLLQKHNARIQQHRRSIEDLTDEFLKQAYRIQNNIAQLHIYLRSVRGPYLSTTQPPRNKRPGSVHGQTSQQLYLTNTQRDAIDAESKDTIRDLNRRLAELSATETQRKEIRVLVQRKQAEKRLGGRLGAALGRWAAGDEADKVVALTPEEEAAEERAKTTDEWRDNVLWFLRSRLGAAVDCQREMMERRVMREVERSKSVLYKAAGPDGAGVGAGASANGGSMNGFGEAGMGSMSDMTASNPALMEDSQRSGSGTDQGLTSEQLQQFAEENNAMLKHYENSLDQVRVAERSMYEIAELQTTLIQNLEIQSERIDQLAEDSMRTGENVLAGNKQLKQAAERWRPAKWFFYVTCGLSGFLVVWDLLI